MSWSVSSNAKPKEKIKAEMADFLRGLNSAGDISYGTYNELFDTSMKLLDRMYELGLNQQTK